MNSYEISFLNSTVGIKPDANPFGGEKVIVRQIVGVVQAKNGIEGIKLALRNKGVSEEDIAQGRSIGSNKRLILAGITFEAKKL